MKHIKKIKDRSILGSIGIGIMIALSGCENNTNMNANNTRENPRGGAFVVIEEQIDGSYKILEEYPSENTRVLLKTKDGNERMLSNDEIDKMMQETNEKIDNGTSQLTNPSGGGLSLGEAILASTAGVLIGSWIGNKLFNNQNYQNQQRTSYKTPQAYERAKSGVNTARNTQGNRSGFFGNNNNRNALSG